jgi:hypothetical protein
VAVLVLVNLFKPGPVPVPASPPPEGDAVLHRLVGTWSVQQDTTLPEAKTTHGTVRYERVVNDKFLRAYTRYEDEAAETLTMFRHDAETKGFRRWFFASTPGLAAIQGPAEGQWDSKTNTLTWRGTLPLFYKIVHEDHWTDADNFESLTEIKDHLGAVLMRQTTRMHRLATNDAIGPTLPRDPKRPAELAVLDQMIGDWNGTMNVTLAEAGNRTVRSESTNHTIAILAAASSKNRRGPPSGKTISFSAGTNFDEAIGSGILVPTATSRNPTAPGMRPRRS